MKLGRLIESEKYVTTIPYERFKSIIHIRKSYRDGINRDVIECDGIKMFLKENYAWEDYLNLLEISGKYSDEIDEKIELLMADFVDFIE